MTSLTKQTVADKFSELHKKYYVCRGYMISTVNDDFAKEFIETHPEIRWIFGYNVHAEANIQTAKVYVTIFDKVFTVLLERPMYPVQRSEFEYYFGFGGHCEGYTPYRMIMRFPTLVDEHGFDYKTLLLSCSAQSKTKETTEEISSESFNHVDITYIKDVFKLLVLGGYVKYWKAWNELSQWFLQHVDDEHIRTWIQNEFQTEKFEKNCLSTINKYVFENIPIIV